MSKRHLAAALALAATLSGCAAHAPQAHDYSAFKASNPKSILVLPPLISLPSPTRPFLLTKSVVLWPCPIALQVQQPCVLVT